jgi:hypothetical protein
LLVERIASPARRVGPEHRPGSIVSPLALLVAVVVDVVLVVVAVVHSLPVGNLT